LTVDESRCVFCDLNVESVSHLFLHCLYTAEVWYALTRWLGVVLVLPPSLSLSYALFVGCGTNKKRRKGFSIIWLSFVWAMWKTRNDRIFNNISVDSRTVVDLIQRLSWQWFVSNMATGPCLLYKWTWNPGDSILRWLCFVFGFCSFCNFCSLLLFLVGFPLFLAALFVLFPLWNFFVLFCLIGTSCAF
jgi:hypothetical protein